MGSSPGRTGDGEPGAAPRRPGSSEPPPRPKPAPACPRKRRRSRSADPGVERKRSVAEGASPPSAGCSQAAEVNRVVPRTALRVPRSCRENAPAVRVNGVLRSRDLAQPASDSMSMNGCRETGPAPSSASAEDVSRAPEEPGPLSRIRGRRCAGPLHAVTLEATRFGLRKGVRGGASSATRASSPRWPRPGRGTSAPRLPACLEARISEALGRGQPRGAHRSET